MTKPQILKSKIQSIKAINNNATEVVLDLTNEDFTFYPGQYVRLTIPSIKEKNSGDSTRDFSIASSPTNAKNLSNFVSLP